MVSVGKVVRGELVSVSLKVFGGLDFPGRLPLSGQRKRVDGEVEGGVLPLGALLIVE